MPAYRCYFFDVDDHVIPYRPPEIIEAANDTDAIHQALSLCRVAPEICDRIELWQGDRLVIKRRVRAEDRQAPPSGPDSADVHKRDGGEARAQG